ncbi:hypothetical protein A3E97_01400 [Candidatus Uhrbacteria bacterium RIFCSPHIGHO2_12_FULL_47_12]|uniref:Uncharacterized protein n=1 Tax=Candidatus Uhrbacteria bacterium RIFCSPLOWO2_02_FULL_48_18 TaxID=1802408 RepID=A0A1F7VC82_9BACT|nr:MAG: hypothetical protein A2839_05290 [Candidatus Uhrbacteria bacterium RIFCSPHIGHO2_01_FULL_47_10]OGL76740.1 MAG: hypothetical protein A3E97_01400 [Candidatus Uhrbacteria bacterium RIFCSPHIGHO2_12_FULL_47_12]OGL80691.1 MAG: hypothetical protein A3B20_04850 [Candidatus Uhrbacteria bacterium RIFCSPLOWO2_01_FULL_47_17]OGL88126.1 MAG: hypothetical protein A3I41_00130 [Candidatus Uhrbacteria bacterium RIFCSPLOWO2_02_FULL_48_18]OGL92146.1 MAG: hypothetical protein A3H12_01680 [Candidatus Uhrbacte
MFLISMLASWSDPSTSTASNEEETNTSSHFVSSPIFLMVLEEHPFSRQAPKNPLPFGEDFLILIG